MIPKLGFLLLIILFSSFQPDSFKDSQLKYQRVRQAYKDKEADLLVHLHLNRINVRELQIQLRAYKKEKQIELWGKNDSDPKFTLIKTYKVCATSGKIGPKRKQGDLQIPEGFYHINGFNPYSNFYLSLGLNYPNKSDRILGEKASLGGDIFIHGACVTIGCLPINNDQIKELYLFCVEAKNNGQTRIPVTIFPSRLSDSEFLRLSERFNSDDDKIGLWTDLKNEYDMFKETKKLSSMVFLDSGRHEIKN
jgi:murein L,D-transpeptidase YafK